MNTSDQNLNKIHWVLRIAVALEFLGHGVFALEGKETWITWIEQVLNVNSVMAAEVLFAVGVMDLLVAAFVLLKPIRIIVLWAFFWGLWTALLRPIVGLPIWDFIERGANWGAPLALLLLLGMPKDKKGWFKTND